MARVRTRRHMWVESVVVGSRPCLACEQALNWGLGRKEKSASGASRARDVCVHYTHVYSFKIYFIKQFLF